MRRKPFETLAKRCEELIKTINEWKQWRRVCLGMDCATDYSETRDIYIRLHMHTPMYTTYDMPPSLRMVLPHVRQGYEYYPAIHYSAVCAVHTHIRTIPVH